MHPHANFCLSCGAFRGGFPHTQYSEGEAKSTVEATIEDCGLRQVREVLARRVSSVTTLVILVWVFIAVAEVSSYVIVPRLTEGLFPDDVPLECWVMLSSGTCALMSALLCRRRGHWDLAAASCAVAACMPLALVMAGDVYGLAYMAAGLFVTLRVFKTRWAFSRSS